MALLSFTLPVPAGAGSGAAVDVSTVDTVRTLIIHGAFAGTIAIEGSNDGTTFGSIVGSGLLEVAGIYPLNAAARFVRVTRAGAVAGSPTVTLIGESGTVSVEELPAAASAVTSVAAAAATTTLLAANPDRRMATFFNDTAARALYLKYGAGATPSDYTVKIPPQGFFEMPVPIETGIITGTWEAGSGGAVLITEETGTGGTGIDPSDLSILINRMTGGNNGSPQRIFLSKDDRITSGAATAPIAVQMQSMWQYIGVPTHGAVPTVVAVPDNSTDGSLKQSSPGASRAQYLVGVELLTRITGITFILYDRLLHIGGLSGTVTTPQTVGGALTRYTGGIGNQIWIEIYTQIGAAATTVTASYTNQDGNAATTQATTIGGASHNTVDRLINLPLASGDTGVRAVASVTLAATTGTAGNFGVTIGHPILVLPTGSGAAAIVRNCRLPQNPPQVPEIKSGACLALAYIPNATVAPTAYGSVELVEV